MRRVELTHDVLCGVVRRSRDLRHEREAREEAERQLAAQREREAATRTRWCVRARSRPSASCSPSSPSPRRSSAYWSMQRAQEASEASRWQRAARGESESSSSTCSTTSSASSNQSGGSTSSASSPGARSTTTRRLPAELRTPDTERNRALAQVRYGAVLRNQGKRDEARQVLDAAIPTLDGLRTKGDASEATAIGLALGLVAQSRVIDGLWGATVRRWLPTAERAVAYRSKRARGERRQCRLASHLRCSADAVGLFAATTGAERSGCRFARGRSCHVPQHRPVANRP